MNYLYLHGFASNPNSTKARFLQTKLAEQGVNLATPDLNLDNFTEITLSKQLRFLESLDHDNLPLVVMGSSLGGYLGLQMAIANPKVEKLILLAPAFEFSRCLAAGLGEAAIAAWQQTGSREFYHYGFKRSLPLNYQFFADALTFATKSLNRELPILIIHGLNDEVVPCQLSRDFAANHPNVRLELVESDHSLGNMLEFIWEKTQIFLDFC